MIDPSPRVAYLIGLNVGLAIALSWWALGWFPEFDSTPTATVTCEVPR